MIPLLQADVMKISTLLEAVQKQSWLKMDVALYAAKKLSTKKQERTNKPLQMGAAMQNVMLETKELSIQQFKAAKRCP